MIRSLLLSALASGSVWGATDASAFWQRGQLFRCADATTPAERERLRCWELEPLGVDVVPGYGQGGLPLPAPPPPERLRDKGGSPAVVRRLG